jgi:hypothetical protein
MQLVQYLYVIFHIDDDLFRDSFGLPLTAIKAAMPLYIRKLLERRIPCAQTCPLAQNIGRGVSSSAFSTRLLIEASKRRTRAPHPYYSMVHEVCDSLYMALEKQDAIPDRCVKILNFTQGG